MLTDYIQKLFSKTDAERPSWQPAHREYLKDAELEQVIYNRGYAIAGKLDVATLGRVREIYKELHNFDRPAGGMFYSVYSRDVEYRTAVHKKLGEALKTVYDSLFQNYRAVLNSFIVKVSGPESEFCLHQDSTGIDETRYSNLSIWIPLVDTDMTNGCLCVVPNSHKMFSPYRGISFEQPFDKITGTVRQYLQPIEMTAGEILLFDNRLVHNSVVNETGEDRVVIMAGIYPKDAPIIACYREEQNHNDKIEIIEQDDDYLITYQNFLQGCRCRPETGHSAGFVKWPINQVSEAEFLAMCQRENLKPTNIPQLLNEAPVQTGLDNAGVAMTY